VPLLVSLPLLLLSSLSSMSLSSRSLSSSTLLLSMMPSMMLVANQRHEEVEQRLQLSMMLSTSIIVVSTHTVPCSISRY